MNNPQIYEERPPTVVAMQYTGDNGEDFIIWLKPRMRVTEISSYDEEFATVIKERKLQMRDPVNSASYMNIKRGDYLVVSMGFTESTTSIRIMSEKEFNKQYKLLTLDNIREMEDGHRTSLMKQLHTTPGTLPEQDKTCLLYTSPSPRD